MDQESAVRIYFEAGVECSCKDHVSGLAVHVRRGYISSMYKQYKKVISPMGCRAFLSPWYERGGMYPADEKDVPVFVGRFNIGAVSLHLPMILAKARAESRDFYEVLRFFLKMVPHPTPPPLKIWGGGGPPPNPFEFVKGGFPGGT